MSSIIVSGDTSGAITLAAPAVAGTTTINLPATSGTMTVTASGLTSGRVTYAGAGGLLQDSSNLTFNGTTLTSAGFSGPLNGTVGATTPSTGAFTTLSATGAISGTGADNNIVLSQNGSTQWRINNSNAGTAAAANLLLQNGTAVAGVYLFGTGYTTNGVLKANSASLYNNNSAGVSIAADNASGVITFASGGLTERMRIDSSGNVGIGTSSPSKRLSLRTSSADVGMTFGTGANAYNQDIDFLNSADSTSGRIRYYPDSGFMAFWTNGSERMRIESDGLLQISKGTYTGFWIGDAGYKMFVTAGRLVAQNGSNGVELAFNASAWAAYSDIRAKTSLTPITDAKTKLKTARTVTGRYITDSEDVSRSFLIAQDWFEILPESVDASDPERLSLRYTETIPLIAAAVNEQTDEIAELKAIIESLTARIAALEAQ